MKQDYQGIEEHIERFFEGRTSNEEERELYDFFSSKNVPEHLLPYRSLFTYFEIGLKEESDRLCHCGHSVSEEGMADQIRHDRVLKKTRIWASIAASLLLLISFGIHHFTQKDVFNPYEGSYIIRNGVKITDPKIVIPEIKKTLYAMQLQEKESDRLFQKLQEISQEDPYEQILKEIRQQQLKWMEQIEDENTRKEILEIINLEL